MSLVLIGSPAKKALSLHVRLVFISSTLLLLATLLISSLTPAYAATPPDSCFAFNAGTGTITDYYNNEANNSANPACPRAVDIPSTIGGVAVTTIDKYAFRSNQLTSVAIPNSVTAIGSQAFTSNRLTSVTIPNATAIMQHSSFMNNPLTTLTIDGTAYAEQVPTTDSACFAMSGSTVTHYHQASPLIARDSGVLCGRSVAIPNSVTSIANSAFSFNQLTSVAIPDSVTSIDDYAFSSNQLTTITIPNSVTSINDGVFKYNRLTAVIIPDSVTAIGYGAFSRNRLTTITIPDSVTTIGDEAFYANRLTAVTIPNSVTAIYPLTFFAQSQWGVDLDLRAEDAPSIWSSDPDEVQVAYDSIWYAKLFTEDPSNPNDLQDGMVGEDWWWGDDGNANGKNDSLGGHIINPASSYTQYLRAGDNFSLQSSQHQTGQLANGRILRGYQAIETGIEALTSPGWSASPEEIDSYYAEMAAALSVYHRLGDTLSLSAPSISGFITPPAKMLTLTSPENHYSFIYQTQTTTPADPKPSPKPAAPQESRSPIAYTPAVQSEDSSDAETADSTEAEAPTLRVDGTKLTNSKSTISSTPAFSGTATPGAEVEVILTPSGATCQAIADETGNWSCTLPNALTEGTYTIATTITNPGGSVVELNTYEVEVLGVSTEVADSNDATEVEEVESKGDKLPLYVAVVVGVIVAWLITVALIRRRRSTVA